MLDRLFRIGATVAALAYVIGWFVMFTSAESTSQGYFLLGALVVCWVFIVPIMGTMALILRSIADAARIRRRPADRSSILRNWGIGTAIVCLGAAILFLTGQTITMYVLPLVPLAAAGVLGLVFLCGWAFLGASRSVPPSQEEDASFS